MPTQILQKRFSQLTSLCILLACTIFVAGIWYVAQKSQALAENWVDKPGYADLNLDSKGR